MRVGLLKSRSILPGFGMTMGFTLTYLSLIVLIPLAMLYVETASLSWAEFWSVVTSDRALAAYKLSFGASAIAAVLNTVFGVLVAWVLVRYYFPGRAFLDALVDLPFALPTAVAGISLTTIYSTKGWIGQLFAPLGFKIAYTPIGVTIALTFIGLPFVVRTLQPVLRDLDPEIEEAAASLGATRLQTFVRVLFPTLLPACLTGFALAFARALGEYGSVVFISSNLPLKTEIAPLLIMIRMEENNYPAATGIAVFMLTVSFVLLLIINILQWFSRRHQDVAC